MAYQNIPVADGAQVVQEIANFASSLGWTVSRNDGTSPKTVTLIVPGGIYVTLHGETGNIYLNGHRGLDTGQPWYNQPEQYLQYDGDGDIDDVNEHYTLTRSWLRVNPLLSVHLFGGNSPTPYLYAAIEKEPGYYRHLVIGRFEKFGTALGGTFWDVSSVNNDNSGSYPDRHRAPFLHNENNNPYYEGVGGFDCQDTDGFKAWCTLNDAYSNVPQLSGGHWGVELDTFFKCSPIQFNGRTPLVTPLVWVVSGGYRPFGTPPAFRYVELTYFEAGDELVIGSETWKVFPWARRKTGVRDTAYTATSDEATEMFGIAYLKD